MIDKADMNMNGLNSDKDEVHLKDEVLVREVNTIVLKDEVPMVQTAEDCFQIVYDLVVYGDVYKGSIPDLVLSKYKILAE